MITLRRLTLAEKVAGAFTVGVVYLGVVGAVSYLSLSRFAEATDRVERTHVVLRLLEETYSLVTGAETGSRGYVITGDAQYLEPFRAAETEAGSRLRALRELVSTSPGQRERMDRLGPLVARRFSIMEQSTRLRANEGFDDAAALTRTGEGRLVMDSIRLVIDAMAAEETELLRQRSAHERSNHGRAVTLVALSFLAAVLLGLLATIVVSRDIERRLRAEEEARRAREVAEAASRAKSEFLAMMSHELRTPLNSVIGFSNVLLRNPGGNLRGRDLLYIERIRAGGRRLLALIDEVLDLSKIEAGRMRVERAPVALGALIEDTIASFEGHVRDRPIELVADIPAWLTPVMTDPGKLLQVLTNLIGNALKFTERGSVTVRVVAEPASRRPVAIEVMDTGIGIPAERQGAIFEAFEQADSSTGRRFGGTGLGLAVSKSLCDLMGYRLEVRSRVGEGSTFTVVLTPAGREVREARRERPDPEQELSARR